MTSLLDLRGVQSSPARPFLDIGRPKSSIGHLDGGKKKGVGLKEMEQTLTSLHKQNFDLKLELYHRREKQTSLEERCEALETGKQELETINDRLVSELEMRDKAVEEAVAMIVSLEARLEELLQEREQFEKNQFFATDARLRDAYSTALDGANTENTGKTESVMSMDSTPNARATAADCQHHINRMPSFMSERSELTENLRSVYLGARMSSLNSLSRMPEDNDIDLRDAANRIASPSLSVLSESSFLSIYGKKREVPVDISPTQKHLRPMSLATCVPDTAHNPPSSVPISVDTDRSAAAVFEEVPAPPSAQMGEKAETNAQKSANAASSPTVERTSSIKRYPNQSSNFQSLTDFLETKSPLRQLARLELPPKARDNASQPAVGDHERSDTERLASQLREHEVGKSCVRQEKRDALRRVRTDGPFVRGPQNLPPTPDTISTSTLRSFKISNDTLSRPEKVSNHIDSNVDIHERSYLTLSDSNTSLSASDTRFLSSIESFVDSIPDKQPPSTSAFDSRRHELGGRSNYFDNRLYIPPRPRSADETTISHHGRGSAWGDSDSSDDDMDIDGNDSASLHDYWLRESLRPTGQPPAPSKSKTRRVGRVSPDLFSFPSTSNGWATTAMFGSLGGQGFEGHPGFQDKNFAKYRDSAPLAETLDALGASLPTPTAAMFGPEGAITKPLPYSLNSMPSGPPPPPHRRSSLHAHTRSVHENFSRGGSRLEPAADLSLYRTSSLESGKTWCRPATRHGATVDEEVAANSGPEARTSQGPNGPPASALPKQRHYPPASGSNNNPTRSRVLSLFRRSGSHEINVIVSATGAGTSTVPTAAAASETTSTSTKSVSVPVIGMPSRVRNSGLDGENMNSSATPPPILRNPRPLRSSVERTCDDTNVPSPLETKEMPLTTSHTMPAMMNTAAAHPPASPFPGQDAQQQEGRKKWLGRMGLRNRAG
ncbi:hypothetical protein SEPCBS119000_000963 [Sporothrix epigloea]|uniref:Centrosomin N-terminal motif 1 domain-containing protein n=1 Tax=Sporothrix epigloea TaxID=1892477 RepID=A0ABP0D8C2_9PEZI